eukprot:11200166-Lingulodinium_polyedra.AAC.1
MTREIEAAPAGARTAWGRHVDSCSIHARQHVESLRAVAADTPYLNEQLAEKSLLSPGGRISDPPYTQ